MSNLAALSVFEELHVARFAEESPFASLACRWALVTLSMKCLRLESGELPLAVVDP
jgi:hypothetical protein